MKELILFIMASCMVVIAFASEPHKVERTMNRDGDIPTEVAKKHLREGEDFLARNAQKEGVVTLSSGLQYKVLETGRGRQAKPDDVVTVDYEGHLLNGHVFDSSYQRGKPVTFPLSGLIAGWREAIPLMHEGSIWMLYIPAALAYGVSGVPGVICANETLIFKIHLISIENRD